MLLQLPDPYHNTYILRDDRRKRHFSRPLTICNTLRKELRFFHHSQDNMAHRQASIRMNTLCLYMSS